MRAQKKAANDGGVTDSALFSYRGVNQDGIEVYETSDEVLALSWKERRKRYIDLMRKEYRGRTAKFERNGHVYYAEFDRQNISKPIYGETGSDSAGHDALINTGADGEIFNLVERSKYDYSLPDTKNHKNTDYFDYFVKTVQIDGTVFDLTADVKKQYGKKEGFTYTLKLIENKTIKASPVKEGQNASLNRPGDTLIADTTVPQTEESVNRNLSDRDSDGKNLSPEQAEYFQNSKVRDKDGNLLVMYHGTPNGGFTKFRSGSYFTENPEYAEKYQSPGASMLSHKRNADNPQSYQVYLNIEKPFDTRNPKERRIFMQEYYRQYGTGAPLSDSGLPDWTDGMDLQEFIEDMGYDYDGLILDEGATGGYGEEVKSRGLSYVTFSPEQVKNVDNVTPTSDPDIRYSERDPGAVKVNRILHKENAELKDTVEYLKELVRLQGKVTDGTVYTRGSVEWAAKRMIRDAGAKGDAAELTKILEGTYHHYNEKSTPKRAFSGGVRGI